MSGPVTPRPASGPPPAAGRQPASGQRRPPDRFERHPAIAATRRLVGREARRAQHRFEFQVGGPLRSKVIVIFACVLGLSSADTATVGASAIYLRHDLGISNTDIGLLVAASSLVAATASVPFGVLADMTRRTWLLGGAVVTWGAAMIWSSTASTFGGLLLARLVLGVVTAASGPIVASLVGDYFRSAERGRIYGYVLAGELLGAGTGFAVTGDLAALSWRVAFAILSVPAFVLAWFVFRLPEPERGASSPLAPAPGTRDFVAEAEHAAATGGGRAGARTGTGAGTGADPGTGEADPQETDAQRLVREQGIRPDQRLVLTRDARRMGIVAATRYVLSIRTNVILIVAGACGYYFLAGVQTFGVEFVREQYGTGQVIANLLMLLVGAGALVGVLVSGRLGDALLRRRIVSGRVLVSACAAAVTAVVFVPAIAARSAVTALPFIVIAACMLSAQNPPIDAARLDIMPPLLWGRAEGIRTLLRTGAQALAPLLFGVVSQYVFGGGRSGLQWTFVVMLLPLFANAVILFGAIRVYPRDVATAAAARPPGPRVRPG
ncbi:MAG: MFS transporter [Acidimicrobiales bacterium]